MVTRMVQPLTARAGARLAASPQPARDRAPSWPPRQRIRLAAPVLVVLMPQMLAPLMLVVLLLELERAAALAAELAAAAAAVVLEVTGTQVLAIVTLAEFSGQRLAAAAAVPPR